ncbi:DUF2510 domain-containing protein [Streptomyces sp. JV176]|nr:DUF2510 domain-containing protein [Streptomyces sp. JV176]
MTTPPVRYPDQHVPSTERRWNGTAWTAHTRPLGASRASPGTPGGSGGRGSP